MFVDYQMELINDFLILKIIDDDFIETFRYEESVILTLRELMEAIVVAYSKRNLDVPRNLFLAILKIKNHELRSIDFIYKIVEKAPELSPYASQIKKLMLFT